MRDILLAVLLMAVAFPAFSTLSEGEAIQSLTTGITKNGYQGIAANCLNPKSLGYKNEGYTVEVYNSCSNNALIGRWRVGAKDGNLYLQSDDGKYQYFAFGGSSSGQSSHSSLTLPADGPFKDAINAYNNLSEDNKTIVGLVCLLLVLFVVYYLRGFIKFLLTLALIAVVIGACIANPTFIIGAVIILFFFGEPIFKGLGLFLQSRQASEARKQTKLAEARIKMDRKKIKDDLKLAQEDIRIKQETAIANIKSMIASAMLSRTQAEAQKRKLDLEVEQLKRNLQSVDIHDKVLLLKTEQELKVLMAQEAVYQSQIRASNAELGILQDRLKETKSGGGLSAL